MRGDELGDNATYKVQEVSLPDKITDKESGERLPEVVEDACLLPADYNGRLVAEIDDRKQLIPVLADFLHCQRKPLQRKSINWKNTAQVSQSFPVHRELRSRSRACQTYLDCPVCLAATCTCPLQGTPTVKTDDPPLSRAQDFAGEGDGLRG